MSVIHCKKKEDGTLVYRLWSNTIGGLGDRVERAEKRGTSCMIEGPGNIEPMKEWKEERK